MSIGSNRNLYNVANVGSGSFIWYCWCNYLSFVIDTSRNRHPSGEIPCV